MLNLKAFRTLQSEDEYNAALKEVRPYFEHEPEEGSEEAAHFDALVLLIEQYEGKNYPIPAADHPLIPGAVAELPAARLTDQPFDFFDFQRLGAPKPLAKNRLDV